MAIWYPGFYSHNLLSASLRLTFLGSHYSQGNIDSKYDGGLLSPGRGCRAQHDCQELGYLGLDSGHTSFLLK